MKKRLLAILLTAAMLMTLLPAAALADEPEEAAAETVAALDFNEPELRDTEMVLVPDDYVPDGVILQYDPPMAADAGSDLSYELLLLQDLCSAVRSALLSGTGSISLADVTITKDEAEQLNHIGYYCPYFDGTNVKGTAYYYTSGKYAYLTITNKLSTDATKAWIDTVDADLADMMSLIDDDSLSVADQALVLHDYMAAHYHYDTTYSQYYPSVMLTEHYGVCQTYAYLFQYLMNREGVECYYTASTSMSHGWNILKIGDSYYHVDITWDDPLYDKYGQAQHDYFLLSDTTIQDSSHNHSGWDLTNYACTDTSYEDDYFLSAVSPVVIDGSNRYYMDVSGLECYSSTSGQTTNMASAVIWPVWNSSGWWYGTYSGLWEDHGKLFYNTASAIMTCDLASGSIAVYASIDTTDGYAYGSLYEDGVIYYDLETTPSVTYDSKNICSVSYTPVHVWASDYTIDQAASCEIAGSESIHCTQCSAVKDTQTIPAPGHSYNSGVITTAATCTTAGLKTYTCTVCGETRTENIPALGHNRTYTDNGNGTHTGTCSRCGDVITESHTYVDGICSVCGAAMNIITQPQQCSVTPGSIYSFTVEATGDGLNYQWQYSKDQGITWINSTIASGKTAAISGKASTSLSGRLYRCVITDAYGNIVTSDAAALIVAAALEITAQPQMCYVRTGSAYSFTVEATGDDLSYQWQYSKDKGATWSNSTTASGKTAEISGTASTSLSSRLYRCVITDAYGNTVTSDSAKLSVLGVKTQPADTTVEAGASYQFTVKASGVGLTYQWQYSTDSGKTWKNSTMKSASAATLKGTANTGLNGRRFRCKITDGAGNTVVSKAAVLTVGTALQITAQPVDMVAGSGAYYSFTVAASGDGLTYQWQYSKDQGATWSNSTIAAGKTAAISGKASTSLSGRLYRCVITDANGNTVTSDSAKLTVG